MKGLLTRGMKALLLLPLLMAGLLLHMYHARANSELHPLVLVPGTGGNQLEACFTSDYKPSSLVCSIWKHRSCKEGWCRLWFAPSVLIAPFTRCFAERMTLYYHPDLDDYRNAPGVQTRVPYFGSTQGLLYLDPHLKHITEYMATLVDALEQIGYRDGCNLFGAPYDSRYGFAAEGHPCQVGTQYLHDLKELIETASAANGRKPVIILSHSLGGLFALQLLNRNPSSWRQKFIKHLITLSTPWAGTVLQMHTFASGYNFKIPLVDPLLVRKEERSAESNLWLWPSPKLFQNRRLVITNNRSYTASEILEFLKDIGFEQGVYPYRTRILPLVNKLAAPGVPITCFIGSGIETPETLFYGPDGFDVQPDILYGDGDGTMNLISLLALGSEWSVTEKELLKIRRIPRVGHISILKDETAVREIIREIYDINSILLRIEI